MARHLLMVVLSMGYLTSASSLEGAVLRVPNDYPGVLQAVDASVAGDSVLVGPGTWTDRAVRQIQFNGIPQTIQSAAFLKPGITVIGESGSENTILDGGPDAVGSGLITIVHNLAGSESTTLEGFTITGDGDGIGAADASPLVLIDCQIVRNTDLGILADEQSITMVDCVVSENNPPEPAGAINGRYLDLDFTRCTFERNSTLAVRVKDGGSATFSECLIADHELRAATFEGCDPLQIERSTFLRNSTPTGSAGGLSILNCTGMIESCTFAYNSALAGSGGAVVLIDSDMRVESNTFVGNHGELSAAAIAIVREDAGVTNNIFAHSTGSNGAVHKLEGPTHPDTGCNLFWNNEGGSYYEDWVPADTDIEADPLFCDLIVGDYSLMSTSPAAPKNSPICGLIGAFGVACGTVAVDPVSWGWIKTRYRGNSGQRTER